MRDELLAILHSLHIEVDTETEDSFYFNTNDRHDLHFINQQGFKTYPMTDMTRKPIYCRASKEKVRT